MYVMWHRSGSAVPESKVHGANMGPTWGRQDPGGPHVGPMDLAIWGGSGRGWHAALAPFYWHGLTLIPAWISNYIHYKLWDEITYPFINFNGSTIEV